MLLELLLPPVRDCDIFLFFHRLESSRVDIEDSDDGFLSTVVSTDRVFGAEEKRPHQNPSALSANI